MSNDFWASLGTETSFVIQANTKNRSSSLTERFRTIAALNPRRSGDLSGVAMTEEVCPHCGSDEGFEEEGYDVLCLSCGMSIFEVPDFGDEDPNLWFAGARHVSVKYRAEVAGIGEKVWSTNAKEYDTEEEAKAWLDEKRFSWFGYDMGRVVTTDTPRNQPVRPDDVVYQNFRTSSRAQGRRRKKAAFASKYPDLTVKLSGEDGNAFAILGAVMRVLRRAGMSKDEINQFQTEATSGDYNHLLQTVMQWVEVE